MARQHGQGAGGRTLAPRQTSATPRLPLVQPPSVSPPSAAAASITNGRKRSRIDDSTAEVAAAAARPAKKQKQKQKQKPTSAQRELRDLERDSSNLNGAKWGPGTTSVRHQSRARRVRERERRDFEEALRAIQDFESWNEQKAEPEAPSSQELVLETRHTKVSQSKPRAVAAREPRRVPNLSEEEPAKEQSQKSQKREEKEDAWRIEKAKKLHISERKKANKKEDAELKKLAQVDTKTWDNIYGKSKTRNEAGDLSYGFFSAVHSTVSGPRARNRDKKYVEEPEAESDWYPTQDTSFSSLENSSVRSAKPSNSPSSPISTVTADEADKHFSLKKRSSLKREADFELKGPDLKRIKCRDSTVKPDLIPSIKKELEESDDDAPFVRTRKRKSQDFKDSDSSDHDDSPFKRLKKEKPSSPAETKEIHTLHIPYATYLNILTLEQGLSLMSRVPLSDIEEAKRNCSKVKTLPQEKKNMARLAAIKAAEDEVLAGKTALERKERESDRERNIDKVVLGNLMFNSWYPSYYPEDSIGKKKDSDGFVLQTLYVCPKCFRYDKDVVRWVQHCRICERNVPGKKVYDHGKDGVWSLYEVDGDVETTFCQNLSLFGKMFLDSKSVLYDVQNFNYFLLVNTDPDDGQKQIVGFFSKEKNSFESNNLACILVFPPWQQKNLGSLLIGISYEIARREELLGGPEKPISDLGMKGYKRYWASEIARCLLEEKDFDKKKGKGMIDIDRISRVTWIHPDDCLVTIRWMNVYEKVEKGKDGKERVTISKDDVLKWVDDHGISTARSADVNGFIEGYAMKEKDEKMD